MANLFGSAPKVEDPARMPDPWDPRIMEAVRRRQEQAGMRGGRLSTQLSRATRPGLAGVSGGQTPVGAVTLGN